MRKVKVKELSLAAFQEYGNFVGLANLKNYHFGEPPVEFFRDMLQQSLGGHDIVSYSANRIAQRPMIVTKSEFHSHTGEGLLPLDGDILIHAGPATRSHVFPANEIEIFHVPKLTLVTLKPGVWHHAPFAYKCDSVHVLIVLPERTYANDCTVLELKDDEKIEIGS